MFGHLRANLWLLVLTLLLCSVLYPLILLAVGQTLFHDQAQGSLALDRDGKVVGSRLIAQPFTDNAPEYFQPRPSAASYNGAASGASNWGANNPLLRDRVARQLGPVVMTRSGNRVGPEVQDWFRAVPDRAAEWAERNPALASQWVKGDKLSSAHVVQWAKDHADAPELIAWRKDNPANTDPQPEDLAQPFFVHFAREHPRSWLAQDDKSDDGKLLTGADGMPARRVKPVTIRPAAEEENGDVQGYFFDSWLRAHPDADLEPVPSDMVMASGSGLDPHITLDNARYQLKHRVAAAWAKRLIKERTGQAASIESEAAVRGQLETKVGKRLEERISETIEVLLREQAEAPLGGLVGVDLVNVLGLNRALPAQVQQLVR